MESTNSVKAQSIPVGVGTRVQFSTFSLRIDAVFTLFMLGISVLACSYWGIRPNVDLRRYLYLTIFPAIVAFVSTSILFVVHSRLCSRSFQLKHRNLKWKLLLRNLVIFAPVAWIYSHMKAGLFLGGQTWDEWLHAMDLVFAMGHDPVTLIRSVVPVAFSGWLAFIYTVFILWLMGSTIWLALDCRRIRASRLTAALVIGYFIGVLAYHLVPSYGPAFSVESARCEHVSPSMHKIQMTLAKHVQEVQADPSAATIQPWAYIGAFPSLHVSHTLILVWYFRYSRVALIIQILFAILTCLATIYFGWHYLIDLIGGFFIAAVAVWVARFDTVRIPHPTLSLR